ncbi:MAG: PQQ-dependent sugar dehydrogenase [Acidimicrobiales bacterium]
MNRHARPRPAATIRSSALARRLGATALALVMAGALLAACGSGDDAGGTGSIPQVGGNTTTSQAGGATPDGGEADEVAVDSVVAASLHAPIAMALKPNDPGHVWVAERAGRVRRLAIADGGDSLTSTGGPVLDISDQTTTEAERGLLGLAFSPDGDTMYVSYTNTDGNSRVVAYPMDGTRVREDEPDLLFAVDQPYPNHNGGNIAIGPDRKLWLGLGDGGAADDPENRAQDPSTPLGKVIRIDPATKEVETVVSGVRNPWRWAFDTDGSLWIADVGQNQYEEVDRLPADQIDGANLGWSGYEATHPYQEGEGRRPKDPVAPVFEYSHDGGNCSITGGFVYRGRAIEGLRGAFLFADYCAGHVRAIKLRPDGTFDRELDLGIEVARPISFGRDQDGEPYVLSEDGNITRIVPGA